MVDHESDRGSAYASVGANITTFTDIGVAGRFHYRVKAYNAQGDSLYSNEVKI